MVDESPLGGSPDGARSGDEALGALQKALGPDLDIKRRLGKGSMAVVYLARESAPLSRLIALKVLRPGLTQDDTARKRFEREAKAAASLTHPNVVQVFRFGSLPDGTPYLVMRFVKGRTMEERLEAEGRLPSDLARQVLLDVASALAAAHARHIVHRDVRPANVLWDEEKQGAVLTDFGIAAILETTGEEATRLTKTGQMIGDPRYLSPEMLLDQDLTELSDMYAFGVLGYELYTGAGPYEAKTNSEWIRAHLNGKPHGLRELRPDADEVVADLLLRCLNREPNHRPSASDVARILGGESLPTALVADGQELSLWGELRLRRWPQAAGTAFAVGAMIIGVMNDSLPEVWFGRALPAVVCGVLAAWVATWFHGERGKQKVGVLETVLYAMVAVAWVVWTVAVAG